MAASTGVAIAFAPAAWRSVSDETAPKTQRILLGIFYSWLFTALWRVHTILWLKAGTPDWFIQNDLIAFYQTGITLGALYHLTSPGAIGGERGITVPSLKWAAVGAVVGVAVFLAIILSAFTLDATPFVEWLRPYIPAM